VIRQGGATVGSSGRGSPKGRFPGLQRDIDVDSKVEDG
jgi:hypothetical protein